MKRSAIFIILAAASSAVAQIPAFPGADGAAANITGGRGGIVYHVTKLDSALDDPQRNDPGTFRYGINNANFPAGVARTIVFDVGGIIHLGRLNQPGWDQNGNGWDSQSRIGISTANLTIAGQTAPGSRGIVFMGGTLKPGGQNQIYRNLTIAPGFGYGSWWSPGNPMPDQTNMPDSYVFDAMDISGQGIMIDHLSTLYGTDEHISANELANNVTVQYTSMSQGQNYPQADPGFTGHAFASLLQAGSDAKMSFHHNLYAHQKGRLPRVGSVIGTGAHNDFRNNVFYNWLGTGGGGAGGQPSFNKFVNNFWRAGNGGDNPVGGASSAITNAAGGTGIFNGNDSTLTRVYHLGNLKDTNKDGDANDTVALTNTDFGSSAFVADGSFSVPYFGITDSAAVTYNRVLDYMGARWWTRDAVIDSPDERIINEVRTGAGKIMAWADDPYNSDPNEGVEWRTLKDTPETLRAADWDQELNNGYGQGDGMPTWWEILHGLNPNSRDDAGDFDADGYTNLEEYLNEIAEWPAPVPLVFSGATNARYEQITNWNINWQPSKYDEAQINAGNVTVNSVGQHARLLKVASTAGSSATLTINGGWIDVAEQVQVANNGQLIITAGQLMTPAIALSNNAQLKLAPGANKTLKTGSISIANNAKLDVTDNKLVLTGMSATAVTTLVQNGRGDGSWNGASGIITSMSDATTSVLTTLAVATADEAGYAGGTFGGQSVSGGDVLVMYTWGGDADLNGQLNGDDYFFIDSNIFAQLPGFHNGDFDYSGAVDGDDYFIIDSNITFAQNSPPFSTSTSSSITAVPEPAAIVLSSFAALIVARRRRGYR